MRNASVEQQTVDAVMRRVPGARSVLFNYGIDPTSRFSLRTAAAAAGVEADEVLAVLEARARRIMSKPAVHAEVEHSLLVEA